MEGIPEIETEYLRDLLRTGLYGDSLDEVITSLVNEGIRRAITVKLIPIRVVARSNGKTEAV